jgi:hypothetical protein
MAVQRTVDELKLHGSRKNEEEEDEDEEEEEEEEHQ